MDPPAAGLRRVAILAVLCALVHAACLRFVFPGYYDPLWPLHSDFYMPAWLAAAGPGFLELAAWPRPVGTMFLKLAGYAGLQGSIVITVGVVLANAALSSAVFGHALRGEGARARLGPSLAATAAYAAFLFIHPHFYEFYTHDMLSQLSFLLLAGAGACAWRYGATGRPRWLVATGLVAFLACQVKETYAISALVLLAASLAFPAARANARRVVLAGVAMVAGLAASLLLGRLLGSPFAGAGAVAGSAYALVLSPASVSRELWHYARETFNGFAWAAVAVSLLAMARAWGLRDPRTIFACALPVAGLAALAPNSVLPNHHYEGYSWNGSYLFYLPIAGLAAVRDVRLAAAAAVLVVSLAPVAVHANRDGYVDNGWYLENEARQRALVKAIARVGELLPPDSEGDRFLVTGIQFHFSPFDHGGSLKSFPHLAQASFGVVGYPVDGVPRPPRNAASVRFVAPEAVRLADYDRVLAFARDGRLLVSERVAVARARLAASASPYAPEDRLLYPCLIGLYGIDGAAATEDGAAYLACGRDLSTAGFSRGARRSLQEAVERLPRDPYPPYFLGVQLEREGDAPEALASYRRAFEREDPANRNPHFAAAIARLAP